MISRAEILALFQSIPARIDLGIVLADREGKVLACNEAARQILRLEQHEAPTTLSDVNEFDLLARIEREDGTDPIAAHSLCRNATRIEMQAELISTSLRHTLPFPHADVSGKRNSTWLKRPN